ncbi:PA2169 family four-helix-bundle protein [Flavobacteriaceae bacterium]|nr:PA2169 family four-helix-bundle protein [Flavobacteriaceae bacterium]MDB4281168.1 PA2169 family four-helix-bundle protein [Flavobacteriaceae bacterium]
MGKQNLYIAQLEKLLKHLKNGKLGYLKAADHANTSEEKRYFNQEALIRNRYFQEALSEIQNLGMSYDDLVVGGFNFNQLLISSIDTLKATALEKCIEADKMLVEIYQSILALNQETKFESNLNRLTQASEQNEMLVSKYTAEKEINPLY